MVNSSSVFIDANIVLEIILARDKDVIARNYIQKHAGNIHISALTAHLLVYFGQSKVDLTIMRKFLDDYFVESLTDQDFDWAFNNARDDYFEDALQLAVAIRTGCDVFATFDKALYKTYKSLPTIKLILL